MPKDIMTHFEKIDSKTGAIIDEVIRPEDLLIQNHRDNHPINIYMGYLMGTLVDLTKNQKLGMQITKELRQLGYSISEQLSKYTVPIDSKIISGKLFGLKDHGYRFRFKAKEHSKAHTETVIAPLRQEAQQKYQETLIDGESRLTILLTGGTGFVGKEIISQIHMDPCVEKTIVLIRAKTKYHHKTGKVISHKTPEERGSDLLDELGIHKPAQRDKFQFIAGDIEKPNFGISSTDLDHIKTSITHVIHCAASVAFDASYEDSYRANVEGTLNALEFSYTLQTAENSRFVSHLSIETSYRHGRKFLDQAPEDSPEFPTNFYNNYYEVTKAIASIETDKFLIERGLRVVQLCPSIVIGDSKTGNNRGDTKVINAPVNIFGRVYQEATKAKGLKQKALGDLLVFFTSFFPGNPSASINLTTVDYVAAGIIAALKKPQAVGEQIQLASEEGLTTKEIIQVCHEEFGARIHLVEPTLYRNVFQPSLLWTLNKMNQNYLAKSLNKISSIFGGYSEWGQPIYEVGNDQKVLGMENHSPHPLSSFRMLCRHNRYINEFGKVKEPLRIAKRERLWKKIVSDIEAQHHCAAGMLGAVSFDKALESSIAKKQIAAI